MFKLHKLKLLKEDMKQKKWTICSFLFCYNKIEYIVLVRRFIKSQKPKNKFAAVMLDFIKADNLDYSLEIEANRQRLLVDATRLRKFFRIPYMNDLNDVLDPLLQSLANSIPTSVPSNISKSEKMALVKSLDKSDSQDPGKIYCFSITRTGNRSFFNTDKTKLLRPRLFKKFKDNLDYSFCYSSDPRKEKCDCKILREFAGRSGKGK